MNTNYLIIILHFFQRDSWNHGFWKLSGDNVIIIFLATLFSSLKKVNDIDNQLIATNDIWLEQHDSVLKRSFWVDLKTSVDLCP